MIEWIADTPILAESWCPQCSPDRDPMREILLVAWCGDHAPSLDGADDLLAGPYQSLSGAGEAEGLYCAMVARLLQ